MVNFMLHELYLIFQNVKKKVNEANFLPSRSSADRLHKAQNCCTLR